MTTPNSPSNRLARVITRVLDRRVRMALGTLAVMAALAGGWWLWYSGNAARMASTVKWHAIAASGAVGLKVQNILVVGRERTSREDLTRAIGLSRGAPILAFAPPAAKARIEKLPWVLTASVERALPDTILVHVQERHPLALWQNNGRLHLIDAGGEVITTKGLDRFGNLLMVVGQDAAGHAAELILVLQSEPELMTQVKVAVRVGNRRWNVRFDNGVDVRLPEEDPADAWSRLAEYERTHQVLARDVDVLDLRLPDRLIVRRPNRTTKAAAKGRKT